MNSQQKPNPKTIEENKTTPSNPHTTDDRFSEAPEALDNRKADGRALSNDVEKHGGPAGRSATARRTPDVNSFDTTRTRGGAISSEI